MRNFFQVIEVEGISARVYGRNDYGEYIVRTYKNGIHYKPSDYFTEDFADACGTALRQVEHITGGFRQFSNNTI